MSKKLQFNINFKFSPYLILWCLFILPSKYVLSQNCSVNVGVDVNVCANQTVQLTAFTSGSLNSTPNRQWIQVSGAAVTIVSPNSNSTIVRGFPYTAGTYRFVFSINCQAGGTARDTVTVNILNTPLKPFAGRDTTFCTGSKQLVATAAGAGETGAWTVYNSIIVGIGVSPTNSNITNVFSYDYGHQNSFRWAITNTASGCVNSDSINVIFCGGDPVVNAGPDRTIDNCYVSSPTSFSTSYTNTIHNAVPSNAGFFCGQSGQWTTVSVPSGAPNPNYSSPNTNNCTIGNLYPGVYRFAWTVSGPCANGSDTVTITVPNPLGIARPSFSNQTFYICGQTTAALNSQTILSGQTFGTWTKISGPAGDSIGDPSSPNTQIYKLKLPNSNNTSNYYSYAYTVCAGSCCMTSYVNFYVERSPVLDITPSQVNLTCNTFNTAIPFTFRNLGFGYSIQRISGPVPPSLSIGYSIIDTTNGSMSLSNLIYGNYVFRIRSTQNGCAQYVSDDVYVNVYSTPSLSNAGSRQILACGVDSTFLIGNIPSVGTGSWTQISGPSVVNFLPNNLANSPKIKNLISGTYTFRWTINGGTCPSNQSEVKIYVAFNPPNVVEAGPNQTTCFGTPIQLKGNKPKDNEIGTWTVSPTGPSFSNVNDSNATVTGLNASTTYKFYWTISNSCSSIVDSMTVTTSSSQGPAQANAGTDQCLSSGTSSITLSGNSPSPGGASGIWRKVGAFSGTITSPNANSTTVTGMSNGTYRFSWTIRISGCDSTSDTVDISILPPASSSKVGPDFSVCGDSSKLLAIKPTQGVGRWSFVSGPTNPTIANVFDSATKINNLSPGSYTFRWTITNGVCPSNFRNQTVQVAYPSSNAIAMPDTTLCTGTSSNTIRFTAQRPTIGTGRWSFLSGPTPVFISPDTMVNTNLYGLGISGAYQFLWVVSNVGTCPPKLDTVTVHNVIRPNAGGNRSVCNLSNLILTGNNGSSGEWSQVGSTPNTALLTQMNPWTVSAANLTSGTYTFVYKLSGGNCTRTDTSRITISPPLSPFSLGLDSSICLKDTNTLTLNGPTVNPGVIKRWSILSQPFGNSSTFQNRSDTTSTATILNMNRRGFYLFRLSLTSGGCSENSVKSINIVNDFNIYAGKDTGRCNGNDTFSLAGSNRSNSIYNWTRISGSASLPVPNDSANSKVVVMTASNFSDYQYKVKDITSRCIALDTIRVMNLGIIEPYALNYPKINCSNNIMNPIVFANKNNVTGITYNWTRNNSNVTGIPNSGTGNVMNYLVKNLTLDTQRVIFSVQAISPLPSNCSPVSFFDTIYVLAKTTDSFYIKADSIIKCYGEPTTLTWSKLKKVENYCLSSDPDCSGTIFYFGNDTSVVVNASYSTYCFTATDSNGCTIRESINLKIPDKIDIPLDQTQSKLCPNDSTYIYEIQNLGGNYIFSSKIYGGGKIYYQGKDNGFYYTPDSTNAVDPIEKYIYCMLDYGKGCPGIDSILVIIMPSIKHQLKLVDDTVCYGENVEFYANNLDINNFKYMSITEAAFEQGFMLGQFSDTIYSVNSSDIHSIGITTLGQSLKWYSTIYHINSGCADTSSVWLTIADVPICNAGADIDELYINDSVQLGGAPTGYCSNCIGNLKYFWSPNDSLTSQYLSNPYTRTDVVDQFTVVVTDSVTGCFCQEDIQILNILPIKWLYVNAIWQKNCGKVSWSTIEDFNNKGFVIQRSYDLIEFKDLGFVPSKYQNNPQSIINYTFLDCNPENNKFPVVYYRIKQIDKNNDYGYSQIMELNNENHPIKLIALYPNPVNQYAEITLFSQSNHINYEIYSLDGKLIFENSMNINKGLNYIQLKETENLSSGMYFIKVSVGSNQHSTLYFIKE